MRLYTSIAVHHFNDCTGLSPYISKSGRFGDSSWQCGRASDWTGRRAKLTLDDGAEVRRRSKSILCISCQRVCLVYRLHGRQQRRKALLSDIRNNTRSGEGEEFSCLTQSACLSLFFSLSLTHTHTHTHTQNDPVTEVSAGLSLPELFVTFPPSCCTSHLLCKRSS